MAAKTKTYQEMKRELDDIIARLESDDVDVDEAAKLHEQGQKLAGQIEKYLQKVKSKIDISKPKS
jgi:exodeoxyribonuclease VII small subunit